MVETAKIGEGVFTISDMATILKVPSTSVRYWFNEYVRKEFPKISQYIYNFNTEDGIFLNFKSLMQLYVFNQLRKRGFSRKKILSLYKGLSEKHNTKYPFAIEEAVNIITAGDLLLYNYEGFLIDSNNQIYLNEVLKEYLRKIDFEDGVVSKFYPLGKEKSIVVNPEIQFGSPVINGTRVNASIIADLFEAGEPVEMISRMYDISESEVNDAIEFSIAA